MSLSFHVPVHSLHSGRSGSSTGAGTGSDALALISSSVSSMKNPAFESMSLVSFVSFGFSPVMKSLAFVAFGSGYG